MQRSHAKHVQTLHTTGMVTGGAHQAGACDCRAREGHLGGRGNLSLCQYMLLLKAVMA